MYKHKTHLKTPFIGNNSKNLKDNERSQRNHYIRV